MRQNLSITPEIHARKQVPIHSVTRNVKQRFQKRTSEEFGIISEYQKVFLSSYQGSPVTLEEIVEGKFHNFVNKDDQEHLR